MIDPVSKSAEVIKGMVFDIARCSFHDGPGIRTTVFLKGCPLDCHWCHNPEGKKLEPQVGINVNTKEKKTIGRLMTVQEVMDVVIKDRHYYQESGGGITISGGEPLYQYSFSLALARVAKDQGINVAVETSGCGTKEHYRELATVTDVFLYDYKHSDSKLLQKYTKGDYQLIEDNFKFLYHEGNSIIRRCPVIPGINDTLEHIQSICEISLHYDDLVYTELLPYHNFGASKANSIGIPYLLEGVEGLDNPDGIRRLTDMVSKFPRRKIILKSKEI